MTTLDGLFIPLITPFGADGEVDAGALERLAHRVLDDGATGIVALGTTAETATLTETERARVLDDLPSRLPGSRGPLIAGAGTNDTARSAAALADLAGYPHVRAALTVVPYYSRPGEAGVLEHFRALAAEQPRSLGYLQHPVPDRAGYELAHGPAARRDPWHRRGQACGRVDRSGHDRDDGRAAGRVQRARR